MGHQKVKSISAVIIAALFSGLTLIVLAQPGREVYLPAQFSNGSGMQEVRALWVTRFDWTTPEGADPQMIDEIVASASAAGFNVLLFQVRAEADAYYPSGIEPWSKRMTGSLGQDPGWDPLARLVERAHEAGLQVHAYLNAYPLWTGCDAPPENVTPRHLYYQLREQFGVTDGKLNAAQWDREGNIVCDPYLRVTPALGAFENHLLMVIRDLVQRYEIDGLHLDHMRYSGDETSCDPVSEAKYGSPCSFTEGFRDWQREQINSTVGAVYAEVVSLDPDLWFTATTWPVYQDVWGWGVSSGYDTYYQDSKAWLNRSIIDGIMPMIYTGAPDCRKPYFWTRQRWEKLVEDYQASSNGRFIIAGLGTAYCSNNDFAEIEARIQLARAAGVAGHAIFSYRGLAQNEFFDDLADGPYSVPAQLPPIDWH